MRLASVVDWRRRCLTAASVFPDGEMRAPNVRNEAVVSICGTVIRSLNLSPDVSCKQAGECSLDFKLAIPALLHFHEITYQKLFSMQIAPPVANNNLSHCWPRRCRLAIAFSSDST